MPLRGCTGLGSSQKADPNREASTQFSLGSHAKERRKPRSGELPRWPPLDRRGWTSLGVFRNCEEHTSEQSAWGMGKGKPLSTSSSPPRLKVCRTGWEVCCTFGFVHGGSQKLPLRELEKPRATREIHGIGSTTLSSCFDCLPARNWWPQQLERLGADNVRQSTRAVRSRGN